MVWLPQPDRCIVQHSISSSIGTLLPTYEQTLLRFCSHLADRLHHSSIKVYLSAIWSLHIDQGFPDPLVNCLQLQRFLRGILHRGRYDGRAMQHSRSPYQDHGQVDQ